MTIALQPLLLVEKIRPVPVCFTLSLRDQRSKWMQDGCTVYIASHMASNGSCVDSPLNIFKNHLLEVKSNIKPGDHGPPKSHNHWFIIFIMYKENPVCIKKYNWNSIWLRARSLMTSRYTWRPVTTLHDSGSVFGTAFEHFFWALTLPWTWLLAHV